MGFHHNNPRELFEMGRLARLDKGSVQREIPSASLRGRLFAPPEERLRLG
jgi:hypothetical protein